MKISYVHKGSVLEFELSEWLTERQDVKTAIYSCLLYRRVDCYSAGRRELLLVLLAVEPFLDKIINHMVVSVAMIACHAAIKKFMGKKIFYFMINKFLAQMWSMSHRDAFLYQYGVVYITILFFGNA